MKYLQANQGIWLIEYLNLVLEKLKKILVEKKVEIDENAFKLKLFERIVDDDK